jgi:Sec-independent protein translocase protein TatA
MEFLGVGLPELAFIVLIALILLGPKDMVAAGRTLGRALRKFITSPAWQVMRHTGEELQKLPTKLIREAGLDELQELQKEVQETTRQIRPPAFDERRIFDPSVSTSPKKPDTNPAVGGNPQPEPPLNPPDTQPKPPSTPDV